jgi:hypothetical protein
LRINSRLIVATGVNRPTGQRNTVVDVFSVVRACLRRWYVFIPLLIVTGVMCVVQFQDAVPQYTRGASYLVVAPAATADSTQTPNPLASASNAVEALVTRLNAPDVASEVAKVDPTSAATAVAAPKGTIILLSVVGSSPEGTASALEVYSGVANAAFIELQRSVNAPTDNYFQLVPLSGTGLSADYPTRSRSVGLIAVGGLALSALVTQLVDAIVLRRRQVEKFGRHADGVAAPRADESAESSPATPVTGRDDSLQEDLDPVSAGAERERDGTVPHADPVAARQSDAPAEHH